MSHNGWKNYETWNINFWVMTDEGIHKEWKMFKRHYRFFTEVSTRATVLALFPKETPNGVSIRSERIDWKEIAKAWNKVKV